MTTQQNDNPSELQQTIAEAIKQIESRLYMERRRHILMELGWLEDTLIRNGDLRYRTKTPSHRKDE